MRSTMNRGTSRGLEDTAKEVALASSGDETWVIVPAFNEGTRILRVLDELTAVVANVVVVDDGSEDDTGFHVLTRPVWLVTHPANLGQGAAIQTGIDFALARGAAYVVTFDADGQHRPQDIPVLVSSLQRNEADFALGSRFLGSATGMPISRHILLKLAVLVTRVLSGVKLTDAHNGLRAMTRGGAASLQIRHNRMEHASEIIDQIRHCGRKYIEVPVQIRYTADTLAKGQRMSDAIGLGLRMLLRRVVR
jgi:glycosyltransferase involved in cell wall biosynthesis